MSVCSCLYFHNNRWYAGGGYGSYSIMYSDDNGVTWNGLYSGVYIKDMKIKNNKIIAVCPFDTSTILYSNDLGANWSYIENSKTLTAGYSIDFNENIWVIGGNGVSYSGDSTCSIIYSEDDGVTWIQVLVVVVIVASKYNIQVTLEIQKF